MMSATVLTGGGVVSSAASAALDPCAVIILLMDDAQAHSPPAPLQPAAGAAQRTSQGHGLDFYA